MRFFDFERLPIGGSVSLLVSATNPDHDSGRWTKQTPVLVVRSESGWTYVSEHGIHNATAADSNAGHRGLYAYVASRNATLFEAVESRELVHRAYRKRRRAAISRARSQSDGSAAVLALDLARNDIAAGRVPVHASPIWSTHSAAGSAFVQFGEKMRFIENPESIGLRFVGAAHDITRLDHTGFYVDEFQSETTHGVVYRLPGKAGRTRYMVGYSDPWSPPAACVSLDVIESESDRWDNSGARDAARAADEIARIFAEHAREDSEARNAGALAREKAREALEAVSEAIQALREARAAYRARHATRNALRVHGLPEPVLAALRLHDSMAAAREALAAFSAAADHARKMLDAARAFRDDSKPGKRSEFRDAWQDGYDAI